MIAYLKGEIIKKTEKAIIISTENIGYLVNITTSQLSNLKEKTEIELFIHNHIREDCFDLYGFINYEELQFFKTLININGIGPKVALEILNISVDKLKQAIEEENIEFMKKIPGIGPKAAQRIILELKGKLDFSNIDRAHSSINNEEAISALISLGYNKNHILRILEKTPEEIKETEDIITFFLKNN